MQYWFTSSRSGVRVPPRVPVFVPGEARDEDCPGVSKRSRTPIPQSPKSTSTLRSTLRLGKPVFQATFDIQFDNDSILLRLHSHIGLGESTLRGRHHRSQQTAGGSQSRSRLPYVQVPPLENPDRNRLRFQRKGLRIRTLPQVARRQRIRKATFLNTEPILTNRFPCRSVL